MKGMELFNGASAEEPTPNPGMNAILSDTQPNCQVNDADLDLIEDLINGYRPSEDQPGGLLPGPPPPPLDLFCSADQNQGWQNPSATKPVLVPRGTACKQNFIPAGSSNEMSSTHPTRVRASPGHCRGGSYLLPSQISSRSHSGTEKLEKILEMPKLVVLEEPKDRGMRFRYECEGRSAGSILGASSTESNKTQPTIEIQGPIDHLKRVTVTVSLVTKDLPHRPHPHCLVGKDCPQGSGICKVSLNPHTNRRHSFANLGIQCVRRKELDLSLQKRRNLNIDPFQTGHSKGIEDMDMNAVRLCFQCELEWDDGRKDSLTPVVSKPIYDKKATTTSELKICHLNLYRGSCRGKTEIYMLCDKVQKDDIEILFKRGTWKANGEFAQTDVHRQIAIVFKTPPYQEQDITEEIEVNVALRRISDQMESEPVTFTYLPYNPDPYGVKRKRAAIKREISFSEKPCVAENTPASDQDPQFILNSHSMAVPDERLHVPHPAGENLFSETQDSNNADHTMIINQLLEYPEILNVLNDPSVSMPNNIDLDVDMSHLNFGLLPQDFSQYTDFQFNMLVNENQNS